MMATPKGYDAGYQGYFDSEYLRIAGVHLENFKQQSYARMKVEKGQKVLDAGCGPGTDTLPLAQLVGLTGEVIGVDFDEAMIAEAEQRAEQAHVSRWVHHKHADVTSMPFETGYFDSCRSERMFQHSPNPRGALAEMTRVTKNGGWVVVLDPDWGSFGIDTDEDELERRLMRFFAKETQYNGYSGRRLYRFFKEQGLADVSVDLLPFQLTSYPAARLIFALDKKEQQALDQKIISEDELHLWHASLEQAEANGLFFSYVCGALATGRKA